MRALSRVTAGHNYSLYLCLLAFGRIPRRRDAQTRSRAAGGSSAYSERHHLTYGLFTKHRRWIRINAGAAFIHCTAANLRQRLCKCRLISNANNKRSRTRRVPTDWLCDSVTREKKPSSRLSSVIWSWRSSPSPTWRFLSRVERGAD